MGVRMDVYQVLVNRVPAIQKEYWRRRKLHNKPYQRIGDWGYLLGLNVAWTLHIRGWASDDMYPDKGRVLPEGAESELLRYSTPRELADRLLEYDVISFDVFDTLLFRYVEKPVDLFHIIGGKLHYLDFARLRQEMEWKARQDQYKRNKSYEVTLEDIYRKIESDVGIPMDIGMQTEIETELEYCYGNPYMLEMFHCLNEDSRKKQKKVICTSDMYLSREVIQTLLVRAGYEGIDYVYVSCEDGASKSKGDLYEKVQRELGENLTYVHTGDNHVSDKEKAREAGWTANHYPNVNELGEWYRARDLSTMTGAFYRGIVNAHIHNGLHTYTQEYELGYIYGGLFITGFCQWIHKYVEEHQLDGILFLARDGHIIKQVYDQMYPEEIDRNAYVYWSRLAATKLGAKYFKYDYFRRFLHHKVNQKYTLQDIFKSMELEDMLEACNRYTATRPETELKSENVEKIEKYLKENWAQVLQHYEEQSAAARKYYENYINGHHKMAVVDIGWAGSGAVVLDYLINQEWGFDCELHSLLAGTNTYHNGEERDTAVGIWNIGLQASYLYSQEMNRDLWKCHDAAKGYNLFFELLTSSVEGSLIGFYLVENVVQIKKENTEYDRSMLIKDIHRGIIDFNLLWNELPNKKKISGYDAYSIIKLLMNDKCNKWYKRFYDKEGI